METLFQKVVRSWREGHHLVRVGAVLFLLGSPPQAFLEPVFKDALMDPALPVAAQVSYVLGIFAALVSVMTLQIVGLVLIGIGTSIKIRQRKHARRTPWWRDR